MNTMTGKKKSSMWTYEQKKNDKHKHSKASSSGVSAAADITNTQLIPKNVNISADGIDSEMKPVLEDTFLVQKEAGYVSNNMPSHDLKGFFHDVSVTNYDDSLDSPPSQNGSSSSLSSVSMTSSMGNSISGSQACNGEDDNMQQLEVSSIASRSSGSKSSGTFGSTAANLASIRDQLAISLPMIKELEKQAKEVPILQVKLSVMKEEKKLLLLQLKTKNTNRRSIGVGDLAIYDNKSTDRKFRQRALTSGEIDKNYLTQSDFVGTSSHESNTSPSLAEGLTSPTIALRLNATLTKKGFNFSDIECSKLQGVSDDAAYSKNLLKNFPSHQHPVQITSSEFLPTENQPISQNGVSPLSSSLVSSNAKLPQSRTSSKPFKDSKKVKSQYLTSSQNAKMKKLSFHRCEQVSYIPSSDDIFVHQDNAFKVFKNSGIQATCDSSDSIYKNKVPKEFKDSAVQVKCDSPEFSSTYAVPKVFKESAVQVKCDSSEFNYKTDTMFEKDLSHFKNVDCAVNTDPVMVFRDDKALLNARTLKSDDQAPLVVDRSKSQVHMRGGYASVTPKTMLKTGVEYWNDDVLCACCREKRIFKDIDVQTSDHILRDFPEHHTFLCGKCNTKINKKSVGSGHYSTFDDVEYRRSVAFKDAKVGSNEPLLEDVPKNKPKIPGLNLCDRCSLTVDDFQLSSTPRLNARKVYRNDDKLPSGNPIFILNSDPVSHVDSNSSDNYHSSHRPDEKCVPTGCGSFKNCSFSDASSRLIGSTSEVDTSDSRDSESSDSPEEGSYDGVLGCIVNKCVDDEAIRQGLPGARMFTPLHTQPRQKYTLSSNLLAACTRLNQFFHTPSQASDDMQNVLSTIQKEWFGLVTQRQVDTCVLEDCLDAFEEISTSVLERIVNLTDVHGNTALHFALSHNNFDMVALLLDTKVCNVQIKNKAGYTPIMLVCLTSIENDSQSQIVWQLLQLGDVNSKASQNGQTALMLAVSRGQLEIVRLLLEAGADVNLQDDDGSTSLMCAAEHGYVTIAQLLLAHPDCDPYITDNDGSNACTIALEAGHKDVGLVIYFNMTASANSPYSSLRYNKWAKKSSSGTVKSSPASPPPNKIIDYRSLSPDAVADGHSIHHCHTTNVCNTSDIFASGLA